MKQAVTVRIATDARLLKRSCESLLGIAAGLIADGDLNDKEIVFLSTWLSEHPELMATWPGEVVYRRVRGALNDGIISAEERVDLHQTLIELIGGSFSDSGAVPGNSTSLPIDIDAEVYLPGRAFCFTGQFVYGTRARCEKVVLENGGRVVGVSRGLDFLVIGELASRDWMYSSHGSKIEAAFGLRRAGSSIKIISEAQWFQALPR